MKVALPAAAGAEKKFTGAGADYFQRIQSDFAGDSGIR